jgi:hypothetical protein
MLHLVIFNKGRALAGEGYTVAKIGSWLKPLEMEGLACKRGIRDAKKEHCKTGKTARTLRASARYPAMEMN